MQRPTELNTMNGTTVNGAAMGGAGRGGGGDDDDESCLQMRGDGWATGLFQFLSEVRVRLPPQRPWHVAVWCPGGRDARHAWHPDSEQTTGRGIGSGLGLRLHGVRVPLRAVLHQLEEDAHRGA